MLNCYLYVNQCEFLIDSSGPVDEYLIVNRQVCCIRFNAHSTLKLSSLNVIQRTCCLYIRVNTSYYSSSIILYIKSCLDIISNPSFSQRISSKMHTQDLPIPLLLQVNLGHEEFTATSRAPSGRTLIHRPHQTTRHRLSKIYLHQHPASSHHSSSQPWRPSPLQTLCLLSPPTTPGARRPPPRQTSMACPTLRTPKATGWDAWPTGQQKARTVVMVAVVDSNITGIIGVRRAPGNIL